MHDLRALVRLAASLAGLALLGLPASVLARTLDCPAPVPPPPGQVSVRFLGVSTLLIEDHQTQILLDGFFSRPNLLAVALGKIEPSLDRIQEGLCRARIGRPVAVLVAHGHYDHAMDSAEIVARRGGLLVGSESVMNIGRGRRLGEESLVSLEGRQTFRAGCFHVTALPAPHASPDRWEGDITEPLKPPVRTAHYRSGGAFAFILERGGLRILVHPSAGSYPGLYRRERADIVFLGIGGLGVKDPAVTQALWRDAVARTQARDVYAIHWDNFSRSLDKDLVAIPWPFENVPRTLRRLQAMGSTGEPPVSVKLPRAYETLLFPTNEDDCSPEVARRFERPKTEEPSPSSGTPGRP